MRLPSELANSFNLKAGSEITLVYNKNGFTVRPHARAKAPKYTLEDMVKGITKKNRHKSLWPDDEPRGKEVW
jgi:antitoxin component of MazEF toxin-antitoxin module